MDTDRQFKNYLLEISGASDVEEVEVIQTLWSGYGKIVRLRLSDAKIETLVVKEIQVKNTQNHPRGWNTNFSQQRKVQSYQVEQNWYKNYANSCSEKLHLPKLIGLIQISDKQYIVMEDLNKNFSLVKQSITISEVELCLKWLANFHAQFLGVEPKGLWPIGTYWHLATRPDELEKVEDVELKLKATKIDEKLNNCQHKTLVHGDAKLANFLFSTAENSVAAVDFQYVGGGCGIKDVSYFLGSCLENDELVDYEQELLSCYFNELRRTLTPSITAIELDALEVEWRELYDYACADFTRFLLGWAPEHYKVNGYSKAKLKSVLSLM